jgi:hypothetical protein
MRFFSIFLVSEDLLRNLIGLEEKELMKCFECPSMAYAILDEGGYAVRWCDLRNKRCSKVWPRGCPRVQRETKYAEAVAERKKRFDKAWDEYQEQCKKTRKNTSFAEAMDYALTFAGPKPKIEDF